MMPATHGKPTQAVRTPGEKRLRSEKRELILESAIAVFARMGYHGARVSDIAQEAGIAYGLVYHYFKNKEEILRTIFEERWSGFLEGLEGIADSAGTVENKLVSVAALMLNAYRLRPEWVKVLVLEIQRSSRFAEPSQQRAIGGLVHVITRLVREGQANGELRRDVDPEVAAYLFIGGLEIIITARVLDVLSIEPGEEQGYYQKVARTVVEVFLRGLATEDRS
jgi:TetR/AcrR family fatty acid metabolism transcriptional regulator